MLKITRQQMKCRELKTNDNNNNNNRMHFAFVLPLHVN